MGYVGGQRARFIKDSLYFMVYDALDELGWFDLDLEDTVEFVPNPIDPLTEIVPVKIALEDDDDNSFDLEMGSNFTEFRWRFYIDVYGNPDHKDDALHLATDIRDILQGRFPSLGRTAPILHVLDYDMATPVEIFVCEIENIDKERVPYGFKPWLKAWYSISFAVIDTYTDEDD